MYMYITIHIWVVVSAYMSILERFILISFVRCSLWLFSVFSNYSECITHRYKNEGKEVNKASDVADQLTSKSNSFVGKARGRKVVKKGV